MSPPAFRFKQREIPSFELSNDPANEAINLCLQIPDFIVDDRSYVSIFDTANEFQSSMAKASFSELDIKASAYVFTTVPDTKNTLLTICRLYK